MKNKILAGFAAVLLVGIVAFAAVAYRGSPDVESPNYDADVHSQLEEAMADGDYDAWLRIRQENNLPTNGRIYQVINEDNFGKYVEYHNANLAGETEKADSIRAELGLGQGMMRNRGNSHGSGECDGSCASHKI